VDLTAETVIDFGRADKALRRAAVRTQAALAAEAGVSRAFVVDLERGNRPGTELGLVLRVLRVLGARVRLEKPTRPSHSDGFAESLAEILAANP
jgi:DNA-binding XRE family transcriptional regulator